MVAERDPKFPKVVSIPSTLTFTPTGCAPGVIQLAPEPTCWTPGTVMGRMPEMSPESLEFFDTERRFHRLTLISISSFGNVSIAISLYWTCCGPLQA